VLNLGYGRGLSVLEVLDALDKALGTPIRREMKGRRAGDPPLLISSNKALLNTLDWSARYADIETILIHALEWERKLKSRNWE
jgi:UDP-glucose 4-epimerase